MSESHLQYGMSPNDGQFQEWLNAVNDDPVLDMLGTERVMHIKVGASMSDIAKGQMLYSIMYRAYLVPNPQWVHITAHADSWLSYDLQQDIIACLPPATKVRVRVVSPNGYFEHSQTWLPSDSFSSTAIVPPFSWPSSSHAAPLNASPRIHNLNHTSVTFTIDGLNKRNLLYISKLPLIKRLNIRGPHRMAFSPAFKDAQKYLSWFLSEFLEAVKDLEEVIVPLDFLENIQFVLQELQNVIALRSLKLAPLTAFEHQELPQIVQTGLVNAVEKGLRGFPPLKDLILPIEIVTPSKCTLVDLLNRMFDNLSPSIDETAVMYYNGPGRHLLYKRPFLFLPAKVT